MADVDDSVVVGKVGGEAEAVGDGVGTVLEVLVQEEEAGWDTVGAEATTQEKAAVGEKEEIKEGI